MSVNEKKVIKTICVYGVGGVGGYFGGKIACNTSHINDKKVYFIARGEHLEIIKENGLTLNTSEAEGLVCKPTLASSDLEEIPQVDLFLICVKSYDLDQVIMQISEKVKEDTIIIPLLNGVDICARIRGILNKGIVFPACTYVATHLEKPGVVTQKGVVGIILFGKDPENSDASPETVMELFDLVGIKYNWINDPYPAIWEKYLFIASAGLVTAYSGKSLGEIASDTILRAYVEGIMREIALIAAKEGIKLPEKIVFDSVKKLNKFPPDSRTSFQRDVEQKGKTNEGDLFGGTIMKLAKKRDIHVPVTEKIYSCLQKRINEKVMETTKI